MPSPTCLKVAIVGCGTAGPAAAILLARQGHRVTLFERSPQLSAVGAGFLLQPTGTRALERLGLQADLAPALAPVDRLHCHNRDGRQLMDLSYNVLDPRACGYGTHRPLLLDQLLTAATREGVAIELGIEMVAREGQTLIDQNGTRHGSYDLIVVCDGARSRLRDLCGIPHRVDKYPWGALWFIGQRTPEFDARTLYQVVHGTKQLNGYLPTGTSDDLLSFFWSVRIDELPSILAQPIDEWKASVRTLVPQADVFLEQITDMRQLQPAAYYDVRMPRWHDEGIVLLGDAAHALSPQLGQGVNLGLMDAEALADALATHSLADALPAYTRARKKHLGFYQFATRWTTPFFQSDHIWLAPLRDHAFPLATRVPYLRRQMVASMAGIKTSLFR